MNKELQDRLSCFVDLLLDAVFLVEADGRIAYVSAACERIFGYAPEEMVGRRLIELVAPEDRARTLEEAARVRQGEQRIGFENRYLRKDGRLAHVMWSARWLEEDQLRLGVARDVTAQRRAEALQSAVYAVADAALRAPDLDALFTEIHRIIGGLVPLVGFAVMACESGSQRLQFSYYDECGNPATLLTQAVESHCCDGGAGSDGPILLAGATSTDGEGECWLAVPLVAQQEPVGALILRMPPGTVYSDQERELLRYVSDQVATAVERARLTAELRHAALHDELTGLPNRRLFQDRVRRALARCTRKGTRMALLYVDIDDFKLVNDGYGHAAGDLLLQEVARRLSHSVREVDTVARLGGDEFVVVMEEIHAPADAATVAEKIRHALALPFEVDATTRIASSASLGIACFPEDGTDLDQLLRQADAAMYRGKNGPADGGH